MQRFFLLSHNCEIVAYLTSSMARFRVPRTSAFNTKRKTAMFKAAAACQRSHIGPYLPYSKGSKGITVFVF